MYKNISLFAVAVAFVAVGAVVVSAPVASAHHNSPMYEFIEENENFDQMDMHEAAIDSLTDNSNMDMATDSGTYTDTATQEGSFDGPAGETTNMRVR